MSLDAAVVICACHDDRWSQLQAALRSVARQSHRPAETIVVVDHNRSLLSRARRELTGAIVVENCEARGLGGARNTGIEVATSAVVVFLDDDAVASPRWLEMLVEPYADSAVAGVGGAIEPMWEAGRPAWFPPEFDWVVGCSYRGTPEEPQAVRNLFGCNMSFRRDLLNLLGRFRLGYGCDETEFCIRLQQRWPLRRLLYVPDGKVLHLVPSDRARLRYFVRRCYFEGGSKAVVSAIAGTEAALASERRYTRRTLPHGVTRGLEDFVYRGDLDGLARATTILAGLTITTAGYAAGRLMTSRAARRRGWSGDALTGLRRARQSDLAEVA